jgi:hypothetical protein
MSESLEIHISKLSRRDEQLRVALKCVLDALREQRSYTDTLYDQMYSLAERIERVEEAPWNSERGEAFREDEKELEAVSVECGRGKQGKVEAPSDCGALPDSLGASGDVRCGEVPETNGGERRVSMMEEISSEPSGEPVGSFNIEERLEKILAENTQHTEDRFASIKRSDAETKKKMAEVLSLAAMQKRKNNIERNKPRQPSATTSRWAGRKL